MAPTHTITVPVRYDECDMYGHVNHANYLRYMQEAAFAASSAVGYDVERYEELGHYWLVYESNVEYLSPLRYGDEATIQTWVADFRRVHSRRAYELRRSGSGELVARGHTDWVYLNRDRQRPAVVPREMIEAFLPDYEARDAAPRQRFPAPPAPPPGQFTHLRRVQWSDVDPTGHVNNAVYVSYLEDCAVQDAAFRGWPIERMVEEGGFAIVARRYRIQYRQQALLGDELELATWISDVKRATAVRHYTIRRLSDGELLTRARALWVWIDLESGRPTRIPEQFAADFAPNIVDRATR